MLQRELHEETLKSINITNPKLNIKCVDYTFQM